MRIKFNKQQEIRWGKPIQNDYYYLCFQLFSRGALSIGVELRRMEVEKENPFKYVVILWWLGCNVKKRKIIVSESSMVRIPYKNKRDAERVFKKFNKVIPEARKNWLELQKIFNSKRFKV